MKFLANLRVIVEAEDWNDAFDFLDELLLAQIAATDAKIVSSDIDYLKPTRLRSVGTSSFKKLLKDKGRA